MYVPKNIVEFGVQEIRLSRCLFRKVPLQCGCLNGMLVVYVCALFSFDRSPPVTEKTNEINALIHSVISTPPPLPPFTRGNSRPFSPYL